MAYADYSFGERSQKHLDTLEPNLKRIVELALEWGIMDFAVTEGHRSLERQMELFKDGKSKLDGVNRKGNHNYYPSRAVDLLPYPASVNGVNVWNDNQRFNVLAGIMYAAAAELGYKIRWGGDWDHDGNNADSTFHDQPHFEILD